MVLPYNENGAYFRTTAGGGVSWILPANIAIAFWQKTTRRVSFQRRYQNRSKMSIQIADKLQETMTTASARRKREQKGTKEAKNITKLKHGNPRYDWQEAYPFTIENVKEFIVFAEKGGSLFVKTIFFRSIIINLKFIILL